MHEMCWVFAFYNHLITVSEANGNSPIRPDYVSWNAGNIELPESAFHKNPSFSKEEVEPTGIANLHSEQVSKVQSYYLNRTMTIKLYDNVVPDETINPHTRFKVESLSDAGVISLWRHICMKSRTQRPICNFLRVEKTTMKLISFHSNLIQMELKQMELSRDAVIPPLQRASKYFPSTGAI